MKAFLFNAAIFLMLVSCSKNHTDDIPTDFIGTWTQTQVYGNDYWGGAAYWKNANGNTKIKFTSNGKYYVKYFSDTIYTYIGGFTKLPNNRIEIIQANPPNPSYPSYSLDYNFENNDFMIWGNFGTEGIIKEKYKLDK